MNTDTARRTITLLEDWAYGIKTGETAKVIDEHYAPDMVLAVWNGQTLVVNTYGRIISG